MHHRAHVIRLQRDDPLERAARLRDRSSAQRVEVEEQVAQVEPRLDVVGIGAGDGVVERLGLTHGSVQPGPLGAQDQLVVGREPGPMPVGLLGEPAGDVGQGAAGRRRREPVVGQRKAAIRVHRRLKSLHGVEVTPAAELALALEIRAQRLERPGGERRDQREPSARRDSRRREELSGDLVHQVEERGLGRGRCASRRHRVPSVRYSAAITSIRPADSTTDPSR